MKVREGRRGGGRGRRRERGKGSQSSKGLSGSDTKQFLASMCGTSSVGGSGALGPEKFRVYHGFRGAPRPQEVPYNCAV